MCKCCIVSYICTDGSKIRIIRTKMKGRVNFDKRRINSIILYGIWWTFSFVSDIASWLHVTIDISCEIISGHTYKRLSPESRIMCSKYLYKDRYRQFVKCWYVFVWLTLVDICTEQYDYNYILDGSFFICLTGAPWIDLTWCWIKS
jgi:hypothetical protein